MSLHVAFVSIPLHGHVIPTLAIVEELVSRGHRVTYPATDEFAGMLEGFGARVLRYESTWSVPARLPNPTTADAMARLALLLLNESIVQVESAVERLSHDVPDVVAYDTAASAAVRPLARRWKCSGVQLFTGVATSERFSLDEQLERRFPQRAVDPGHPVVREHRRRLGAFRRRQDVHDRASSRDLSEGVSLVFQPRAFHTAADAFDDRYVFVGPCAGKHAFLGEWSPPAGTKPVLLVTLGTLYNRQLEFFRSVVCACTGIDCHVVMAVGPDVDPADVGVLPANIDVHRHVPQLTVLAHARAFVTHGGMGSTMEGLLTATPLVVVPQTPEQDAVARRVAELGLGRRLPPAEVTADALRTAVLEVMTDEATRQRVRDMQRHAREAGGAPRAVDTIEACVRAAAPSW